MEIDGGAAVWMEPVGAGPDRAAVLDRLYWSCFLWELFQNAEVDPHSKANELTGLSHHLGGRQGHQCAAKDPASTKCFVFTYLRM